MSGIFKAYDIRGIYPEEINEDWAYRIGKAFAVFMQREIKKDDLKIVLAMDNRLSSASLYNEAKKGLLEHGITVIEIGLASTPMLYFAVANYGFDGGLSITASHNGKEYNGFKFVRAGAFPVGEDSGLKEIEEMARNGCERIEGVAGEVIEKNILVDYIEKNKFIDNYSFNVFIDTANGIAGLGCSEVFNQPSFKNIFLNLDGSFPNHDPNPLKEGSLDILCEKIRNEKGDLGIAFDGDGDRVFFVDEKGKLIPSDLILALCAESLLKENKRAKILYDIRCSRVVKEVIEENGGEAIMSKVGHSFIKKIMREQDILFGGEYSGHFYSKNDFFTENPYFVAKIILEEMKKQGGAVSEIIEKYKKYHHSGEINFQVDSKDEKILAVKEKYKEGRVSLLDGVRIDFDNWWISLRASNTEPLIRLIVEAETEELLVKIIEEVTEIITN